MRLSNTTVYKPADRETKVLPLKAPARAFRYRKTINWTVDLSGGGINGGVQGGSWEIELHNPFGSVLFKQKVTLKLMMVSLGVPGLQLFTWNYVRDDFDTSVAGGIAVTKETIGQYLLGGTALSEQGDLNPASGYDSTDLTATIVADWFSPIYVFDIPVGSTAHTKRDQWGFGSAVSTFGYAFEEDSSSRRIDSVRDMFGGLLSARIRPAGRFIEAGRAWPNFRFREPGGLVKGSEPSLLVRDDGMQVLGCVTPLGFVEFFSQNDGWRWERMRYPDAQAGFGTIEKVLWSDKATMPLLARIGDRRITIAILDGWLLARLVNPDVGEVVRVGRAVTGESYSIDSEDSGRLLIVDSSGLPVWESQNGGLRWSRIAGMSGDSGEVTNAPS